MFLPLPFLACFLAQGDLTLPRALMEAARDRVAQVQSYSATYSREEVLEDGTRINEPAAALWVRHSPPAVSMQSSGRTVTWAGGATMHVRAGPINRDMPLAASISNKQSRRTIDQCGMLKIAERACATFKAGKVKDASADDDLVTWHCTNGTTGRVRLSEGFPVESWTWDKAGQCIEHVGYKAIKLNVGMASAGYPLRSADWTGCTDWRHLTQGEHAGKFDPVWLQSLSADEIQSLHSDDHEGRVHWDRVVRLSGTTSQEFCPT